ncbi:hypothetical protein H8356DRAFT_1742921 [Neocallimastix lanati (nom. inval.)]|jgi:hypothetical protein|uniref:Uncharacterized protein n=1 Tax=Neocallimastix californiae TaxID=1754190 RepID=A0A1Y2B441_9FUNG|nr:hypothetical protein H8356DRAFT_1742921 [Neocallimastix sp. JGI-2020a]ORY29598.1 hypothetical protein LY90DRAFT_705536 [Neocallimastix californiae]|eukprot:ORY29598.1 hypothetical protein LY90DRAFT_705536 [Neocallimastix californiae]
MVACDYLKRFSSTNCEKMFASRTSSQSNRDEFCRNSPRRSIHQRCHSLSNNLIPLFNSICRYSYNYQQTIMEDKEEERIISPVAVKPLKNTSSYISYSKKYSNDSETNSNDTVYEKYPLRLPTTFKQSIPNDNQNDAMAELLEIFCSRK